MQLRPYSDKKGQKGSVCWTCIGYWRDFHYCSTLDNFEIRILKWLQIHQNPPSCKC